jgi:LacI family transcriptional regulator
MTVTLKNIADRCGVSHGVVGAVLSGRKTGPIRYSDATREKVLAAAEDMGYRRNRVAAQLRSRRHQAIALLTAKLGHLGGETLLQRLIAALHERDHILFLDDLGKPRALQENLADALICFEAPDLEIRRRIDRIATPLVQINTNDRYGRGCITFDEEACVADLLKHFASKGCTKPLIVYQRPGGHYSHQARVQGLAREAALAGMAPPVELPMPHAWERPLDEYAQQLRRGPAVDFAVLLNDNLAPFFYLAAGQAGYQIGRDLLAVGYNDTIAGRSVRPELSGIRPDEDLLVDKIMEGCMTLIEDPHANWRWRCPMRQRFRASSEGPATKAET